jgi:hypothetical protein
MADSEERLAATFRKIHARQSAFPYLRPLAVSAFCIALASVGADLIGITAHPGPWWLYVPAIFAARFFGGDLAGWVVVAAGCFVSADIIPVAPEVSPASNCGYIFVRLLILACMGGVRSLPSTPFNLSGRLALPVIFRTNHFRRVAERDVVINRIG